MADILDAAQTTTPATPADTSVHPPTPPTAPEPVEPPPTPMTDISEAVPEPTPTPPEQPSENLIVPPPEEESATPSPAEPKPAKPKKKINASLIITGLLLILVTLPLTVFFVSRQKEIADIRSLAAIPKAEQQAESKKAIDPTRLKVVEKEYNAAKKAGKDPIAAMRPAAEQAKIDAATAILKQKGLTNPTDAQVTSALSSVPANVGKNCGQPTAGGAGRGLLTDCGAGATCGSGGVCVIAAPTPATNIGRQCGVDKAVSIGGCGSDSTCLGGVCIASPPIPPAGSTTCSATIGESTDCNKVCGGGKFGVAKNGVGYCSGGASAPSTPGTTPAATYPQPSGLTVTFNCSVFSGGARALCFENNDYAKTQVNTTGKIPTVNSLDPDAVANMIAGATCPASDTKCKASAVNTVLTNMRLNNINGLGGTPAPGLGPISCSGSGYSGFEDGGDSSKYVSEPCPGGGYLIERIATRGCPNGQARCWCSADRSNCKTNSGGGGGPEGPNPTTPPVQCTSVRVYDAAGNTALTSTDLAALKVGDTITLGFTPPGSATKVRFKVNTGDWNETTTRVGSEFRWTYTLENTTSFSIVAQWFDGTNWN